MSIRLDTPVAAEETEAADPSSVFEEGGVLKGLKVIDSEKGKGKGRGGVEMGSGGKAQGKGVNDKAKAADAESSDEGRGFPRLSGPANLWYTVTTHDNSIKDVRDGFARYGSPVSRMLRIAYGPFELGKIPRGGVLEVPVPKHIADAARRFAQDRAAKGQEK